MRHLFHILGMAMALCLAAQTAQAQNIDTKHYYRIVSVKSGARAVDVQGQSSYNDQPLVIWTNTPSRTTQDWQFRAVEGGEYYQILSRHGGWAIYDQMGDDGTMPSESLPLLIVVPDTSAARQLWKIVPQANSQYNLKNKETGRIFNVKGGEDADGTYVISYTSDQKDATSQNRLWVFQQQSDTVEAQEVVPIDTTKTDDGTMHRLTNLPHVYINTEGGAAITTKKTFVPATLTYIDEEDNVREYTNMEIRGRGNSTWNRNPAKKPYRIRFAQPEQFLGEGHATARNWTLMANAYDKSLIRNALTSELSRFTGQPFSVAAKFVDVTLNGEYIGTYHISDHPEAAPGRVELKEGGTGTDVSYFLEVDGYAEHNWFSTSNVGVKVRIHTPKDDLTTAQKSYIQSQVNAFEAALMGSDFKDPVKGYRQYVDSVSLANWFCANEICANYDGYWSLYFYKQTGDGRFYFGPMWDYDIAYSNDSRPGDTAEQLMSDCGAELNKAGRWVNRMWEDPWFQQLVNRRLKEIMDAGVEAFLLNKVDSLSALIYESQALNYKKYGISTKTYNERVLHSTYEEYIEDLRSFIRRHCKFLPEAFATKAGIELEPEPFEADPALYYKMRSVRGDIFWDVRGTATTENAVIVVWATDATHDTQKWVFRPQGDYYQILSHDGTMAITDASPAGTAATSTTSANLKLTPPDATNAHQLWSVVPQAQHRFNFINLGSGRTANLDGGTTTNNTRVISYATDEAKNKTGQNRLWYIDETGEKAVLDGITYAPTLSTTNTAAYDVQGRRLHGPAARGVFIVDGKVFIR
ncbi:MAG: CotH kinase family protein [Alloprevotella sp.]|nr:CotH kinase family protein [Alloprevotella sp.]